MGKKGKGKKAGKVTGTPEVIKFKGTKEFNLLRECVSIQESLPFVASDVLDELSFRKVARFLNMVGLLSAATPMAGVGPFDNPKEYRFRFHHELVLPIPQYFPLGYSAGLIKVARQVCLNNTVLFNNVTYEYPIELAAAADVFLKTLDADMTKIASAIEPSLKSDFGQGLKRFWLDLGKLLKDFDDAWAAFEKQYLEAKLQIDKLILAPIQELVDIESRLTESEQKQDWGDKQSRENELTAGVEGFVNTIYPDTVERKFFPDVLPLAEACVFYEKKLTPQMLDQAKHVIKDYLELRIYLSNVKQTRLELEYLANNTFCRLLKKFYASVIMAEEALVFVEQLPKIINTKQTGWMTRQFLEADLIAMKKQATENF